MPTPIAHSAVGLAVYLSLPTKFKNALSTRKKVIFVFCAIALALFPDFDFLPGIAIGHPGQFHHGPSHSLVAALFSASCFSLLASQLCTDVPLIKFWPPFATASLSHPLLDALAADRSPPFGIPFLWPFSSTFYISPFPFFGDVARNDSTNNLFLSSLFSLHNLKVAVVEVCLSIGLIALILGIQNRKRWSRAMYLSLSACSFIIYYNIQVTTY